MTELRTFRIVGLALGDAPPVLPGGIERAAALQCCARTLDAFLAEIDAGAELPDAVLVFDGARAAALLRRHERCALLPILVFGPAGAPLPPGCDAVVQSAADIEAAAALGSAPLSAMVREAALDSERRAQHFFAWMQRRGRADAADAVAFGIEAPHSLLREWEAAERITTDPCGGWRLCAPDSATNTATRTLPMTAAPTSMSRPSVSHAAQLASASAATRFGWPALFLVMFGLWAMQAGGVLGPPTAAERARRAELSERLVLGNEPAVRPQPRDPPIEVPSALVSTPNVGASPPEVAIIPVSAPEQLRVIATASVQRGEESLRVAQEGEFWHRRPSGGGFAAGEVLGALRLPAMPADPGPHTAHEEALRAAQRREAIAQEHYQNRSRLATAGVLAWREVAPDWEEWEAARAHLEELAAQPTVPPVVFEPAEILVRAPRAGTELRWLRPHRSLVRADEEVLRFATGAPWLEVRLAASEWSPAAAEPRAEARWGGDEVPWRPIQLRSEERDADGSRRLRFEWLPQDSPHPLPAAVEVRWTLAGR